MGRLLGIAIRHASRSPMIEAQSIEVTPQEGLTGDFRGRPGRRQVTVLNADDWTDACDDLNVDLPWTTRRANLLISGVRFGPESVGRTLKVGDLELTITAETDPCGRMTEAHQGLREVLTPVWRGGVCCQVLAGSRIAVGDPVRLLDASAIARMDPV